MPSEKKERSSSHKKTSSSGGSSPRGHHHKTSDSGVGSLSDQDSYAANPDRTFTAQDYHHQSQDPAALIEALKAADYELSKWKNKCKALEKDLQDARVEHRGLDASYRALVDRNDNLEEDNKSLSEERHRLQRQNDDLREEARRFRNSPPRERDTREREPREREAREREPREREPRERETREREPRERETREREPRERETRERELPSDVPAQLGPDFRPVNPPKESKSHHHRESKKDKEKDKEREERHREDKERLRSRFDVEGKGPSSTHSSQSGQSGHSGHSGRSRRSSYLEPFGPGGRPPPASIMPQQPSSGSHPPVARGAYSTYSQSRPVVVSTMATPQYADVPRSPQVPPPYPPSYVETVFADDAQETGDYYAHPLPTEKSHRSRR